jgi:hypothetical protein
VQTDNAADLRRAVSEWAETNQERNMKTGINQRVFSDSRRDRNDGGRRVERSGVHVSRFLLPGKIAALLLAGCVLSAGLQVRPASAAVTLIEDDRPQAVVVLPAAPSAVERYAAEELVYHLEKATGVRLVVVGENDVPADPAARIYVGRTQAAVRAGVDFAGLTREALVLRSVGDGLIVTGEDTGGDPLVDTTRCGTLWGVYELLDRFLGVRWLWPGELGVHVPKHRVVTIPDIDQTIAPAMIRRRVRDGLGRPASAAGLTADGYKQYARAQRVFQRRHRMGSSLPLSYGHAFEAWWERYGNKHPEFFQLLADGRRGPATPTARFSMCVSNPDFQRYVIDQWKRASAGDGDRRRNVNGCENDISGLCQCERCLAWDGPQPELSDIYPLGDRRMVSDRYARFWLALQQLAAAEDPEANVVGYAYFNYYPAPTSGIQLNRHVLVGMCPWPGWWYPRTDGQQQWLKQQWDGWSATGASMFLRPNYFLDSYTMPHIFARQFADEFQHYARHGMIATDFDSLTGQWAAQGTNLYLLFRLHTRAEQPVDDLLAEYYSAFGPAAEHVRRYFETWEAYTMSDRDRFERAQREAGVSRYRSFAAFAHVVFPDDVFPPAEAILRQAAEAAADDPVSAARVEYLRLGLEHARMCSQLAAANAEAVRSLGQAPSRPLNFQGIRRLSPVAVRRLREELVAFRRATEGLFLANYDHCASVEESSWKAVQGRSYDGSPLCVLSPEVAPLEIEPAFSIRHEAEFVAVLAAGQRFEARIAARRVGRVDGPVEWLLYGPDDQLLEHGQVAVDQTGLIDAPAPAAGVYLLVVRSGQSRAVVTLLSPHAAMAGNSPRMISQTSPMFFHVPADTERFQIALKSPAPGETAQLLILDPDGRQAARVQTTEASEAVARVEVPADAADRAWQVRVERAERGVLEDYSLVLDEALPPYWAHAVDRLVVPQR